MDKRANSGRGEPIPSILKKPKTKNFVDKSSKIKGEKVAAPKKGDDVTLPKGCTPLMYACQQADYKAVIDILNKDPSSIRVRDRSLRCALHYCASSGASTSQASRANCADRLLMAAPALANTRDADGLTPLHLAVVHGNVPLVQTLLASGADVNARDDEQHTVVHWATVCGEVGALRAVLASGADPATPDQHGGYPMHYAAQMCGAPANNDHQSRGAALEVLRALVKEGGARVDVRDADGRTPLLWAASAGSAAAVMALHQAGAKVDDADRDGLTALHCAAARGHTEVLETLVGLCGAKVDVADTHGCTPLHYAAALGHADATVALLQHGADSHRQDKKGRSPAHTAAAKGHIETIRILGAHGANLWLRNSKGDLPLHEAVASGRRELVKWLLDGRPSQVNATNHEGRTPLHIAAATDNADLCRLLLDRGAEVNPVARSSKNEPLTPLDCATNRGHRSTAKYLQMHGGLPASKLANTQIIIDGAPITALPSRRVTSTKIDVHDKIRIEKREVVEVSSPMLDRRRIKNRQESVSSDDSYSDYKKQAKRSDYKKDKRKRLESQKSFSDGYESGNEKQKQKYNKKGERRSKEHRSKSEPSRRSRSNSRHRKSYLTESDSSSESQSYSEKKKSKRHRKRSKRKTTSSSESSSSESSDRRSTKRKGKKTSIHIENDEEKQCVNIVKYKKTDSRVGDSDGKVSLLDDKSGNKIEGEQQNAENKLVTTKTLSETETDTVSVKTNMVVTEAQVHMERESDQHGTSELIVTVDSSNNVSIEATNMTIQQKHEEPEDQNKNLIDGTENVSNMIQGAPETILKDTDTTQEKSDQKEKEVDKKDTTPSEKVMQEMPQTMITQTGTNSNYETQESVILNKTDEELKNNSVEILKELTPEIKSETPGSTRKRSFEILSGPNDVTNADAKQTSEASQEETPNNLELESQIKGTSSSVSFAQKDEIFISKDSEKGMDHLMGEKIANDANFDERGLTKDSSESNVPISSEDKRKNYASTTTGSSTEITQSTDKGLVGVLEVTDRAVQQVIMENVSSEDINIVLDQTSPKRRKPSRDSQVGSRKNSIYETESYKVLSEVVPDVGTGILKRPIKVDGGSLEEESYSVERIAKESGLRVPSVSDNEIYHSEANGRRKKFRKKGRAKSRTTIRSKSENSERGYDSSGLMDSGFEPSPRAQVPRGIMSPRLAAYYRQRNASGRFSGKSDSRIPVRKPGDKHAVDMKSVTQKIQTNMRRYYCERKIFHHLLELKRLQIRTSKANEAVLVKRAIDEYNKSSLTHVGLGPYNNPDFSFSSFEKFLYENLRKLQKSGKRHLDNLPEKPIDFDYGESELYNLSSVPDNPCLCTHKTHRCFHAVHAYTGIPCSAYIPYKWNHHTMPKPATAGGVSKSKSFLPKINSKPSTASKAHVTLEVSHGTEKQLIALPAEKLDKNKRYYVTFTVKGSEPPSDNDNGAPINKTVRSG